MRFGLPLLLVLSLGVGVARAGAQSPAGVVTYAGRRATVVLSVPGARDLEGERAGLEKLVKQCARVIDIRAGDSVAFVRRELPQVSVASQRPGDYLEVVLLPRSDGVVYCGDVPNTAGLAELRASVVTFDTLISPGRRLESVTAMRGDKEIEILSVERHMVRALGIDGYRSLETDAIRFVVPMRDVLPTAADPSPTLELLVETFGGAEVIELQWPILRELWDAALPMRVRALGDRAMPLELPRPDDAQLRHAHAAYRRGSSVSALRLASALLTDGFLSQSDIAWSRALAMLVFDAAGDELASGINAEYLLLAAPCFTFDATASESVRRSLANATRPAARCQALSTRRTISRSLLMPGFGRPIADGADIAGGLLVVGAIGWTAAHSQKLRREARGQYQAYLDAQVPQTGNPTLTPSAAALFAKAERTRGQGIQYVGAAVAIYAGQALFAAWRESRFGAAIEAQSGFGEPTSAAGRVGLHRAERPSGVGIGVEWRW